MKTSATVGDTSQGSILVALPVHFLGDGSAPKLASLFPVSYKRWQMAKISNLSSVTMELEWSRLDLPETMPRGLSFLASWVGRVIRV
ncbi:hypothetical protein MUK42_34740 [Musa troglodytarum]|uniref:Uncharacterized protein n=1 Tax=Musa troglodytarum TaxID=320322 RepID=A0A9E7GA34_9LILI|nr:hypothetical protein MUK42_34740 [Musa troglodytarum]